MMSDSLFAVYGSGGCGRGVLPLAREQLHRIGVSDQRLVFIDDYISDSIINGHRVLSFSEFIATSASERYVTLAISDGLVRKQLSERCSSVGIKPWTIKACNVKIMDHVILGEGTILCPFVTLTSNIQIGKYFHANLYSYIEHDCVVGNYVTFGPGVKCNGNVIIEDHAYIGTGVMIKQGRPGHPLTIGRHSVVGMGAVVTKDVAAGVTVIGNPARPLVKKEKLC